MAYSAKNGGNQYQTGTAVIVTFAVNRGSWSANRRRTKHTIAQIAERLPLLAIKREGKQNEFV